MLDRVDLGPLVHLCDANAVGQILELLGVKTQELREFEAVSDFVDFVTDRVGVILVH